MSKNNQTNDFPGSERSEFYIGWQPDAPRRLAGFVKKTMWILLPVVTVLGIVLALSQSKFSTGTYEFGILTEVKGIYFNKPVPHIKILNGRDIWGNAHYITVPLIGYGKYGADGVIADIENEKNMLFEKKEVTLKGTLLYNDGKLLMQIDKNDNPLLSVNEYKGEVPKAFFVRNGLGNTLFRGEIVDPKCYFGVMKPGEGKPHKDCAIRCILGGIPPVLKVTDDEGKLNYYLVVGSNGERMNEAVRDYVATPVTLNARAVQFDDWIVLYVDAHSGIKRYSYIQDHYNNTMASCAAGSLK